MPLADILDKKNQIAGMALQEQFHKGKDHAERWLDMQFKIFIATFGTGKVLPKGTKALVYESDSD